MADTKPSTTVAAGALPSPSPSPSPPRTSAPRGFRGLVSLLWAAINKFFADSCGSLAAALSFYTFFSLPALLTLLLTLLGSLMDPARVRSQVIAQVGSVIGRSASEQVATIITNAHYSDNASVATMLSVVLLAFGATTAFAQLQSALNRIWGVKPDPNRNQFKVFLLKRVFSFGVVVTVAFLLLVSLVVSTGLAAVEQRVTGGAAHSAAILHALSVVVSFGVIAVLFAVMFRYLPDARIGWHDVRAGAFGSALLFVLGKAAIGFYLGRVDPGSTYGAAGSLAIVLIWVYYTSMIFLFGAEFTEEWARRYGSGIVPAKGAVAYIEEERHVSKG